MQSEQIKTEIAGAEARRQQIADDLADANQNLEQANARFVKGEIGIDELTSAQSKQTALQRASASIAERISQLNAMLSEAVRAEAMEAFKTEISNVEAKKAKLTQQFAKEVEKAEAAFAKIIDGLAGILRQGATLTDEARASLKRLRSVADDAESKKMEAAHRSVLEAGIINWPQYFQTDVGKWLLPQAVAVAAGGRMFSAPERRPQPVTSESEVARRLSQPVGSNEVARRLGRA